MGHEINGIQIECDKAKVRLVLSTMIEDKMQYLEMVGDKEQMRWIGSLKHFMLHGLPLDGWARDASSEEQAREAFSHAASLQAVSRLTDRVGRPQDQSSDIITRFQDWLQWEPEDDATAKRTGRTLLFYASLCNSIVLVQAILVELGPANINTAVRNPNFALGEWAITPLMGAMMYGNFEVVILLLEARARPEQRTVTEDGYDALMLSAAFGRMDNIRGWLTYFGGAWSLERTNLIVSSTTLLIAALQSPGAGTDVVPGLLDARANPHATTSAGGNLLTEMCMNENSMPHLIPLALAAGVNVNDQPRPRMLKWRVIECLARSAVCLGITSPMLHEIALWDGETPLMCAANRGKVLEIQALLAAGADPTLRNRQGRTALDIARASFGGTAPPMIAELLNSSSQATSP